MSNEYKDWLSEQTFETLANDNLRVKQQLLQLKAENEHLTQKLEKAREALKEIKDVKNTGLIDFDYIKHIAQQALKGLEE